MPDRWRPAADWSPGPDDVIDVWHLDLMVREEDWTLLSTDETQRARRILVDNKRDQKVSARAHLRRILARYGNTDPAGLVFEYGEHGKPELTHHDELHFNLSHSRVVGLVAVTRGTRIGVDVEYRRENRALTDIANRFFSAAESSALLDLAPEARASAFYRAWAMKEAYLKAWGTGLSFASNRFTLDYVGDSAGRLVSTDMPGDDPDEWRFEDVPLRAGYTGAICFEGLKRPLRRWNV